MTLFDTRSRRRLAAVFGVVATALLSAGLPLATASEAGAHGFSSVAYADVSQPTSERIDVVLSLEYDLLEVSVATAEQDDAFYRQGQPAWEAGDFTTMAVVATDHLDAIGRYVLRRFTIASHGDTACTGALSNDVTVSLRNDVPYAQFAVEFTCQKAGRTELGHTIASTLFPDSERFVTGTNTIVTYRVDGTSGSATLDSNRPSFSTEQTWYERFWEFFSLGAEHLLTGVDHILFLIALIVGSRRLREVVLAATAFTVAHSITFILAALGVVSPPAAFVEPAIALSIAAVAGWSLWRIWRKGASADRLVTPGDNHLALDTAGWSRLAVVFAFGLIHGLGFAGALGIHEAFSWQLLWSLIVFNLGIEAVQLTIIALVFPLLAVLRHRAHGVSLWVAGIINGGVFAMGLVWFVERMLDSRG